MRATTIKIGGKLLEDIERVKPEGSSVTAHVKHVLQKDLEKRELRDASTAFKEFVEAHPEERAWLAEWDRVDLASTPAAGQETG